MHNAIPEHGGCEALSRPASTTTTAAALRVYIEPLSLGHRGQYYSVSFEGRTLIAKTLRPSSDACRALVQLGFSGPLEIWDRERSYPRLVFRDIHKAAGLTIAEGEHHGPRVIPYREWSPFDDDACRSKEAA